MPTVFSGQHSAGGEAKDGKSDVEVLQPFAERGRGTSGRGLPRLKQINWEDSVVL